MNTPMRILVAYDGSECAAAALDDLRRAGLPHEAIATVLSVAEIWPPPPSTYALAETDLRETAAAAVADARLLAEEACDRVRKSFPCWDVRADARFGSPSHQILETAAALGSDLLVVGSHGRSALGQFFLGSISQSVVAEAPCSVRVAKASVRDPDAPARVLVGLGQESAEDAALRAVAERSWPTGTQIRLATAFGPYRVFELDLEEILRRVSNLHRTAVETLLTAGLHASSIVSEGDPRKVLVDLAADWAADVIFLGARDLGRAERGRLGSVSRAVVARAHCSVEVIRG